MASTTLLFAVVGLTYRALAYAGTLSPDSALAGFLGALMAVNVVLFAFNLIPLPPLDRSKFLLLLLQHPKYLRTRLWIETRGPTALLFAVLLDSLLLQGMIFGTIIGVLSDLAFRALGF